MPQEEATGEATSEATSKTRIVQLSGQECSNRRLVTECRPGESPASKLFDPVDSSSSLSHLARRRECRDAIENLPKFRPN